MNYEVSYLIAEAVNLPIANSIIYLVPPLTGNFFSGIHTTLTVEGDMKIGPSVLYKYYVFINTYIFPALWRE